MVTFWIEREKRVFGFFSSSSFIYCICGDRMNLIGIISQGTWTHIHVVGQQQGKQSCILLQWTFLIQDVWVLRWGNKQDFGVLAISGSSGEVFTFPLTTTTIDFDLNLLHLLSFLSLSVVNFSSILDSKRNSSLLSLFS